MDNFQTPIKNKLINNVIQIPPSPLMKKIGFGTHVVVYEFQRSPLPEKSRSPWAIKKLIESHKQQDSAKTANKRLKAEAEILRKLNHPNIVGFRACTKQSDDTCIIAMEGCTSSLGDLIENRLDYLGDVPFPPNTILKMSSDIVNALDYLHNEKLLHGDIKSMNILVKGEFVICKLCDFGVSLPLTKGGEIDKEKAGEDVEYAGTPHWCAPEVFQDNQIITSKADIYSFGLVIWEMLSLAPPNMSESFEESSFNSSIDEKIEPRQRPPLPDVDLGPEYNLVLEIYFCCTIVDFMKRPNAQNLVKVFNQIMDKK
ncbi:lymphokine-activated killer T-cell-originated protein kinase [Diorhabda sublineata]|uniref:lymphokine-activated killer T-cell-originated protein kinase n=1 Tax=Diorhabda sublineata TaxID=1163346 RepID=UPI0024E09683|nr:lymphokine-activated killer T-cell-originated protein kinase [Diorhabda sublineata]